MRLFILAGAAALLAVSPAMADTKAPATAAAAVHYSSSTTQLGTLLDNPASKAVLLKHIPQFVNGLGDNLDRASGMTLKELQAALKTYSPDAIPDAKLAAIDADLATVPVTQ